MNSPLTIKPATRQGVKPLIGLYSESGCGKTMSSLLLARGLAGPTGKLVLIDSESGRGSLYADVIPGGYDVLDLCEPFSPARYIEAITAAENSGAAVAVIDSGSHSWEGLGGVLDMAGDNEARSGKAGLHNWKTPKMEHAKFMLKLLQSRLPIIVCLRAKYKTRQTKINGKTEIVKDDYTTPIQADDFIFETTAHGEIMPDHSLRLTKCSHPSLRECFPKSGPITIQHGEALARWCANPGTVSQGAKPATVPLTPAGGGSNANTTAASTPKPSTGTEAQRVKMFDALRRAGIDEQTAKGFAEHKAWLAPFDDVTAWPLAHVPTVAGQMASLIVDIQSWKDGR